MCTETLWKKKKAWNASTSGECIYLVQLTCTANLLTKLLPSLAHTMERKTTNFHTDERVI